VLKSFLDYGSFVDILLTQGVWGCFPRVIIYSIQEAQSQLILTGNHILSEYSIDLGIKQVYRYFSNLAVDTMVIVIFIEHIHITPIRNYIDVFYNGNTNCVGLTPFRHTTSKHLA